jgi:hypothetical protein
MKPELAEAIRAALPERRTPRLMADFAVRLARLGHASRISVTVAETEEAVLAACAFFAERGDLSEALPADTPKSTPGGALDAAVEAGGSKRLEACVEACTGHSDEGHKRSQECPPGQSRVCGLCGRPFRVNRRHTTTHAYCSATCRSKARHRRNRPAPGNPGLAPFFPPETTVYLDLADPTDAPGLETTA